MIPLIAAAAGLASAGIGAAEKSAARNQAGQLIQQTIAEYEKMGIPSIEAQKLVLEEFQSQGVLTPELEQMVTAGPSAVGEIALDPAYEQAQMGALDELMSIGQNGGMRLSDQASLEKTLSGIRQQERGGREAILANARERGMSGSGNELVAQLMNQQGAAQDASYAGLQIAGDAQDRALDALLKGGSLAGDIRSQSYGEELNAARANDEINKFNTMSQMDINQRNVAAKNNAAATNLSEKQRIADANTGMRNQNEAYEKGLYQKQFDNQLALNQAKGNARAGQASNIVAGGQESAAMWGGIGQGINQIGTQWGQSQQQQKQYDDYMDILRKQGK